MAWGSVSTGSAFSTGIPRWRKPPSVLPPYAMHRTRASRSGPPPASSSNNEADSGPPLSLIPCGPFNDILRAWHGVLGYEPALVKAPVALIRGEWDGVIPDEDARWLFAAFAASPNKRDVKICRGTHLVHLEAMRPALYRETNAFL